MRAKIELDTEDMSAEDLEREAQLLEREAHERESHAAPFHGGGSSCWALSTALLIFTNVWVAGAAGALVASIVIAPSLLGDVAKRMRSAVRPQEGA